MQTLLDLDTPSLVLDLDRLDRNIAQAKARCAALGVTWRPHLKTHKCVDVARRQTATPTGPVTVSTVKEAEYFSAAGITDIIYAVGIDPHKLPRLSAINAKGADVKLILDNVPAARAVSAFCKETGSTFGVLVEIDCDGHRSGVQEGDPVLFDIVRALTDGARFLGILTHAGESYSAKGSAALLAAAEHEALSMTRIAASLREAGFECPIVSVGSTPTIMASQHAHGVTEYRSGVGTFFDLFMAGVGVCTVDDIALSVLATVIGHQEKKGRIITDAGWLAMSRDRGTANQERDCGYGLVCDVSGRLLPDLIMSSANQEHGIITAIEGKPLNLSAFPLGTRLRILPNHACPTAAAFDRYQVVRGTSTEVAATWTRINNW